MVDWYNSTICVLCRHRIAQICWRYILPFVPSQIPLGRQCHQGKEWRIEQFLRDHNRCEMARGTALLYAAADLPLHELERTRPNSHKPAQKFRDDL